MYNMMTIVSNTVFILEFAKRFDLSIINKKDNWELMDVLVSLFVIILPQCIRISNHPIVHLKYIQLCLLIISQ